MAVGYLVSGSGGTAKSVKKDEEFMTKGRWFGRLVRGLRPDRNPLRRTLDRMETFIFGALVLTAAVAAPLAAIAAGRVAYADALRAALTQQATRHETTAVLLAPPGSSGAGMEASDEETAPARWKTPAGTARTGQVAAPQGSKTGAAVPIWTDPSGAVTTPPLSRAQVADQSDFATFTVAAAIVVICVSAAGLTRFVMNRRRLAAWAADWAVTAPMWNRQRW